MLELSFLGRFDARTGRGVPIALPTRKTRALLAYLALHPDEAVSRQSLTGLLWSDRPAAQANNSLSKAVSAMRKAFAAVTPSPLVVTPDSLRIVSAAVETDVLAFGELSRSNNLEQLDRAESLYRGELLAGIGIRDPAFEEWLELERRRLHVLAVGALTKLLDLRQNAGQQRELIATAQRLLDFDPFQEAAHRVLIHCYAEQGQIGLALSQYDICANVLERELGLKPAVETTRLRESIVRQKESMRQAQPSSDKPSIAVLPFANMSGDPAQEYFSDGITEDIITELSRFRSLLVVARHSSFAFKELAVDIKKIGRELGVRYIVEGSVRKTGDRIRVTSQLIDAASGNHIWAERYDRELEHVFEIQDDLVRTIVSTVGGRIEAADKSRASRCKEPSVPAYDLCLRAQALQDKNTKEAYTEAEHHLRQAIEIDPHIPQTYHQLSLVKFWQWFVHWSESPEEAYKEAFELADKALALDETDGLVHAHLCLLHIYRREFDEGGYRIGQALRLNPNDTKVLGIYGNYLIALGESDKAIELLDGLTHINPLEPAWITRLKAIAYMTAGRYQDAISLLKPLESPTNLARGWLTASLANAGRLDEAREALEEFLRVAEAEMVDFPGRSLKAWRAAWYGIPYKDPEDTERFFEGLRKAGLAE